MSFDVSAKAYDLFMGRFSVPLADAFVEWVGVQPGQRAVDVGCGPGALTAALAHLLGPEAVTAVDPSASFVEAVRARVPGVDVHVGTAEALPVPDDSVDVALAQLVVHFMTDPVRGLADMARVTRPAGTVAACVWDHAGDRGPLAQFWAAARQIDPVAPDESLLAGVQEGDLARLATEAGLQQVESSMLTVAVAFATFAAWWQPFTLGVGPAGAHVQALGDAQRRALRDECARRLGPGPFELSASAWCVLGRVPHP